MKHFHDLPTQKIREYLKSPWQISEKIDGSYMRAGFDAEGRFYTLRKSNMIYYNLADWPKKPWTNAFRAGHLVLETLLNTARERGFIKDEFWIDVELTNGVMPNSIIYQYRENTAIVTGTNNEVVAETIFTMLDSRKSMFTGVYTRYEYMNIVTIQVDALSSNDGTDLQLNRQVQEWRIYKNHSRYRIPQNFTSVHDLVTFFDNPVREFRGLWITNEQVLNLKLNSKPDIIEDMDWKSNRKEILEEIKQLRAQTRLEFRLLCDQLRSEAMAGFSSPEKLTVGAMEGLVVEPEFFGEKFKLVDVNGFGKLNNFTHIVRYWLQGGRRPERPCFLTRTRNWPTEQRLARLEVLRQRYIENKRKLKFNNVPYYLVADLDQRTLCAFAELKERITHGRDGI